MLSASDRQLLIAAREIVLREACERMTEIESMVSTMEWAGPFANTSEDAAAASAASAAYRLAADRLAALREADRHSMACVDHLDILAPSRDS